MSVYIYREMQQPGKQKQSEALVLARGDVDEGVHC
jgi:hypothetical protein